MAGAVAVLREYAARVRLFQPNGYLSIEFLGQKAVFAGKKESAGEGELPEIFVQKIPIKKVDPLETEIQSFLQCVRDRTPPRVSGRDGKRALELALQITRQIHERLEKQRMGIQ